MPQKWNYYEDKQFFLSDYFSNNARKSTERDKVYEHLHYVFTKNLGLYLTVLQNTTPV